MNLGLPRESLFVVEYIEQTNYPHMVTFRLAHHPHETFEDFYIIESLVTSLNEGLSTYISTKTGLYGQDLAKVKYVLYPSADTFYLGRITVSDIEMLLDKDVAQYGKNYKVNEIKWQVNFIPKTIRREWGKVLKKPAWVYTEYEYLRRYFPEDFSTKD